MKIIHYDLGTQKFLEDELGDAILTGKNGPKIRSIGAAHKYPFSNQSESFRYSITDEVSLSSEK